MKIASSIKTAAIAGLCSIALAANAQLKVTAFGDVGVGTTSPLVKFHMAGNSALFTSTSASPASAAMIRGANAFSSATKPDYTWFSDDQTGLFHPSAGQISFSCLGNEYARVSWNTAHQFYVYGSGFLAVGPWAISDRRFKRNIAPLQSSLDKVMKLQGVSYEYNREQFKKYNLPEGKAVGLIAQDLQLVVPEAVKADDEGYLAVNYSTLIPLLIESIKEQQKQIEALKQQAAGSTSKTSAGSTATGISDATTSMDKPLLYQNAPNPFNTVTVIKYYTPGTAKNVNIYVYDISGNKKKSFDINERGEGSIEIAAHELGKGIYFYSMVVDGKIQDSKTMLITE